MSTRRILLTLLATGVVVQTMAPAIDPVLGPTLSRIAATGTLYVDHHESATPFSFVLPRLEDDYLLGYSAEISRPVRR
jgi:hypothetical protein